MNKQDFLCIQQISEYCKRMAETMRRFSESFDTFITDTVFYNSISMSLMQLGEQAVGLSQDFKTSTSEQIPWSQISSIRDKIEHEFISVDKNVIWNMATKETPNIKKFCDTIIANETAD